MKLSWTTDIHLNFLDSDQRIKFYQEISRGNADGVLITGDIAEADCVESILNEMAAHINKNIYFVLGNHDYYRGQLSEVRAAMDALTQSHKHLFWLPACGPQKISSDTILLGQDGWADGRLGDYANSRVVLNDSRMIADLFQGKMLGKFQLLERMQQLADADANQLANDLNLALQNNPKKIIVLTHVPPFKEACMYDGKISDDDWLPFMSSKATGDVLMQFAQENPSIQLLVLAGHTHGAATFQALDNLMVKAGKAEYNRPEVQEVISVEF